MICITKINLRKDRGTIHKIKHIIKSRDREAILYNGLLMARLPTHIRQLPSFFGVRRAGKHMDLGFPEYIPGARDHQHVSLVQHVRMGLSDKHED